MDLCVQLHLIMDQERKLRRAEARERLGLEEQAARGLLDADPVGMRQKQKRGLVRLQEVVTMALARLMERRRGPSRSRAGPAVSLPVRGRYQSGEQAQEVSTGAIDDISTSEVVGCYDDIAC